MNDDIDKIIDRDFGATALLFDTQGRLILQKRDSKLGVYRAGLIGLFGGTGDQGETPFGAIQRELFEELELQVTRGDIKLFKTYEGIIHPEYPRPEFVFILTGINPEKLILHEGEAIIYAIPEELEAPKMCMGCHQVIKEYFEKH